jgi:predicted esterase
MKKLFLFLLLIPALLSAQKVEYFPKRTNSWDTKTLRQTAFLAASPDNNAPKPWKLMVAVHGVGERGPGTTDNLKNLWLGFDYNNDGIREAPGFVTADMKKAINQYGIVLIIPTYETNEFFEPSKINELYEWAQANFSLHPKMLLTGFSYGGGAVFKYISSSLSNAQRVAYAVPCAGVSSLVDASIPGKAGIPVHAFSNDKDPTVNVSNTINQVNNINKSNPDLKAIYTVFRRDGHGSNDEAWSFTPPKAPGGQGFTDAAENIYQVFDDIIKTGKPRQMKSGTITQPLPTEPTPIPEPVPEPAGITAEFNLTDGQVINTEVFEMDASASTGAGNSWDSYRWDALPVKPSSNKQYGVGPDGAYGGPKKKLLNIVDGNYSITLTVKSKDGKTASKTVTVTAKIGASVPAPKTVVSFSSETDLITYSDGSTEKGSAVFSSGKWVLKNSAGQVINL